MAKYNVFDCSMVELDKHHSDRKGNLTVVENGSKDELKEAIRKMVADSQLTEKGKLGKNYLVTELDKEKCVKRFVDTLVEAVK